MIAQDYMLVSWVCMKYFHVHFLQVTTPPEAWDHVSKSASHVTEGAPAVPPFFFLSAAQTQPDLGIQGAVSGCSHP